MDVDKLLASAVDSAGTSDFGPETDAMLEALRVLVRSVNEDAALDETVTPHSPERSCRS